MMSAADIAAVLFFRVMRFDPGNPISPDSDKFIMSKGHAAPLLWAALVEAGTLPKDQAMTLRESPGVISYITRDEIRASGARNIVDVLRLVPGFQVGYDTEGSLGLATRGFWSY